MKEIMLDCKTSLPIEAQNKIDSIINEADKKIENDIKAKKGANVAALFLLVIIIGSVLTTIISFNKIDVLQNDIYSKSAIIQKLQYGDSLFNKFMATDSLGTFSYKIRNGKSMTYSDLSIENNSLEKENMDLKNGRNHLENEISDLKDQLLFIKNEYGICIRITIHKKGNKEYESWKIYPSKVDTALMIYPFFKNKVLFYKDGRFKIK